MKKFLFIAALLCLLVSTNQVSAQLIIRNNGHAEIGTNPNANDADASTVLKIFGDEVNTGAGAKIAFGDTYLYTNYNGEVRIQGGTGSPVFHHSIHI